MACVQQHAWGQADSHCGLSAGEAIFAVDYANSQIAMAQGGAQRAIVVADWPTLKMTDLLADDFSMSFETGPVWQHLAFSRDGSRFMAVTVLPEPEVVIWQRAGGTSAFALCTRLAIGVQYSEHPCCFFPGNCDTCCCIGACPCCCSCCSQVACYKLLQAGYTLSCLLRAVTSFLQAELLVSRERRLT